MSDNLRAYVRTGSRVEEITLWQTPTYVTHMLLVDADGEMGEKRGRDAIRVLRAYCKWVMGEAITEFNRTHNNYDISSHEEHVRVVMDKAIKAGPNLVVGMV